MVAPGLIHCAVVYGLEEIGRRWHEKGGMNRLFHCLLHDVTSLPKLPEPVLLWAQAPWEVRYPWAALEQSYLAWEVEVTVLP